MKKAFIIFILAIFLSSNVFAANYVTCDQAMNAGKPFILYLHSNTCGACKRFTPLFAQIMDSMSGYSVVDINYSYPQKSNVCSNAESRTIPAVYVVNPQKRTRSKISYDTYYNQKEFKNSLLNLLNNK